MIYFLFRFLSRKNGLVRSNAFQLLGGIPLGQNKSIQFVEIGQKIYVLGIGQDVHLLQIIDNQEELQQIRDLVSAPSIANDRLIGWLNHIKSVFSPLKRFMEKKNLEKIHSIKSFEELLNRKMADLKEQRTQSLKEIIHTKSDTSTEKLGKRDSDE
ncbi:flagellar biosynthetic protein FliO [Tepidibacillus fermentans]|nr:flagellar biosynthetic protein FliO [Tepidibacillus fermentans]